jgi:hypothetical protein
VSRRAGEWFLGYLRAQKVAMTGEVGAHTNRPELVPEHGYDSTFAMHALRLGVQGAELLTTGRISLPVPEPERSRLRTVRRGEVPLAEVLAGLADAEVRLVDLQDSAAVPAEPDRAWVDEWLHRAHLAYWSTH